MNAIKIGIDSLYTMSCGSRQAKLPFSSGTILLLTVSCTEFNFKSWNNQSHKLEWPWKKKHPVRMSADWKTRLPTIQNILEMTKVASAGGRWPRRWRFSMKGWSSVGSLLWFTCWEKEIAARRDADLPMWHPAGELVGFQSRPAGWSRCGGVSEGLLLRNPWSPPRHLR